MRKNITITATLIGVLAIIYTVLALQPIPPSDGFKNYKVTTLFEVGPYVLALVHPTDEKRKLEEAQQKEKSEE